LHLVATVPALAYILGRLVVVDPLLQV